jgi:hypothetical protein
MRWCCKAGRRSDLAEFGLGDSRLLMRRIPKPREPHHAPHHPYDAEHEEGRPPTITDLNRHDEQRREGGADLRRQPDDAPCAGAPGNRNPASDDRGGIGIGACLAGAETEPHQQQDGVARDGPRECGEGGPPGDDTREDATRSDTIAQCAGGYFEYAVGKIEDAGDPAPGFGADLQIVLHARPGDGDADTIQIGDDREQRQHAEHSVLILDETSTCRAERPVVSLAGQVWASIGAKRPCFTIDRSS